MRARRRCSSGENPLSGGVIKSGEIQEPRDAIHIEQVHLVRAACETHSDERCTTEKIVLLQCIERHCRQKLVVAKHDIGSSGARNLESLLNAYYWFCLETELGEEAAEMLGNVFMSRYT